MFILITRQLEQSEKFADILNKENIKNVILPVIQIKKIKLKTINLENIKNSNFVIFTSQNSATLLMQQLDIKNLIGKKIAAIGVSTKKTLNDLGVHVDIFPESDFTSESLFKEIESNNIVNRKIIIVKGVGGRNYLHKKLSKDNHMLDALDIYERELPSNISYLTMPIFSSVTHICITSIAVLDNFIKISSILKFKVSENVTFVAGNERIAQVVKEFFPRNKIIVSLNPSNIEMLNTLLN